MILLLRIITASVAIYFLYMVYLWWQENYSPMIECPQCDGDGVWESMGKVDTCLLCKGKGKIEREL